jgi:hypothetical protein
MISDVHKTPAAILIGATHNIRIVIIQVEGLFYGLENLTRKTIL